MAAIAIVGGGPGGLMTAHFLGQYLEGDHQIEVLEASSRVGGKIVTRSFGPSGPKYEAGAAEFYDYSALGPDPLRELIESLGLETIPMTGPAVALGNLIIPKFEDMERLCGTKASTAAQRFYDVCAAHLTPESFYEDEPDEDNAHPLTGITMRSFLDTIEDDTARRYIEASIHSDLAAEPHSTTALYGIKNVLLDDKRYASYYCIVGGNERLIDSLSKNITAKIRLERRVTAAEQIKGDRWRLSIVENGKVETRDFDIVVFALPNYWLGSIDWRGDHLRHSVQRHLAHYDRPGHYLRVTARFTQPFWRKQIAGSWFMHDAFGGCCVYDESSRLPTKDSSAVLSWLIAGTDAMAHASLDNQTLISRAVASLPETMVNAEGQFIEGHVNRWIGTVNALPGGATSLPMTLRHQPDQERLAGLYFVGDYMHDTTLNGALDSAEYVAGYISVALAEGQSA